VTAAMIALGYEEVGKIIGRIRKMRKYRKYYVDLIPVFCAFLFIFYIFQKTLAILQKMLAT